MNTAADLSITKTASSETVVAGGGNLVYTLTVNNSGPSDAQMVSLTDALPSGMTFAALSAPADWTCSTPAAGAGGTVSCAKNSLAAGAAPAAFTLTVKVNANVTAAAILNTASVASATADPNQNNNSSADFDDG